MKTIKLLSIILCLAMLLPVLVACNKKTDGDEQITTGEETTTAPKQPADNGETTEDVTTAPEELYENEESFVSFVSYDKESASILTLGANHSIAGKFTIPEGYLEQLNAMMNEIGDVVFSLYVWDTDFKTTVAGEPIKQKTYLKSELEVYVPSSMYNMELNFEENEVGAGTYLYVLTPVEDSENIATIFMGGPWPTKKTPEEYQQFELRSFIDGDRSTSQVAQSSFVYIKQVPQTEAEEQPLPTEKDAEGTAKVILIGGQSNAEGVSPVSSLQSGVSAEKFLEYTNGYSNVQIMYNNLSGINTSEGFVNTAVGQGSSTEHFGPELGIAEYLAENFPDEKFYIIKYALGGSILETQWYNAASGEACELLEGFTAFVQEGLDLIEAEGLTPKIVGFVWNQGESDAIWLPQSSRYYANQEGLVNYVRTAFADYASAKGIGFMDAGIRGNVWNAYKNINLQKYAFSLTSPINFYIETLDYDIIRTPNEVNDVAHYNALGMIKLGQLYGEQIAKMLG